MRILLFDWTIEGHHKRYIERFTSALSDKYNVLLAIPEIISNIDCTSNICFYPIASSRPPIDPLKSLSAQNRELAEEELDLFEKAISLSKPDHAIHLYSDPIMRRLIKRPNFKVNTTLCIFFPRVHYPGTYNSSMPFKEMLRAWFLQYLILRWRRRRDAYALLTLDEEAAIRWSMMKGAPAYYYPEPPIKIYHRALKKREDQGA